MKKGKAAKQLMKHVVNKIGDGVELPDELFLRPFDNKTFKVLGTMTSQASREADEAQRSNHEQAQAARAKAAFSLLEAAKKQKGRWGEGLFEDGDEGAESWLEVISKYYGVDGKNGWKIVPRRERPADEAAPVYKVADMESSDDDDDEIESASDSDSSSSSDSDADESQEEPQQAKSKNPGR